MSWHCTRGILYLSCFRSLQAGRDQGGGGIKVRMGKPLEQSDTQMHSKPASGTSGELRQTRRLSVYTLSVITVYVHAECLWARFWTRVPNNQKPQVPGTFSAAATQA